MMTTPTKKPDYLKLSCVIQPYAWGKVGLESEVARLKKGGEGDQFTVDHEQTYAELWMGTHPKGPSTISHPVEHAGQMLSDWLKSNRWALGDAVSAEYGGELPYLFKVLSINKALSIQAHPTKSHAELLHRNAPDLYRDPNHKPELAVAISEFEGFCGFRPLDEIRGFVLGVPELRELVGREACDHMSAGPDCEEERKDVLKEVFTALMQSEEVMVKETLGSLVERLQQGGNGVPAQEASLLLRLNSQFPGDIGCFCVFFLNFLRLQPGESLYLAPNEPHAYLHGEVMECMACSDNVVRAGLTIKHRDKDTLCQMLTYKTRTPQESKFLPQPHPTMPCVQIYDPPTPEFTVARIAVPKGSKEFILPSVAGPSVLIFLAGSAVLACGLTEESAGKGVTIFLPAASSQVRLLPNMDNEQVLLFQAYCNP